MPKPRALRLAAALVLALIPAAAAAAEPDLIAIAGRVAAEFAVRRYAALAAATRDQAAAWDQTCAAPRRPAGLAGLKEALSRASDAWAAVEVLRYGPVAEASRYERISHWPERRNAITRGLAPLLAGKDPADLEPARLRQASAAVQGLSALERVLYDADAKALGTAGAAGDRRCAVGRAIAAGLAAEAEAIRAGWADGPDALAEKLKDRDTAREALTRIATDVLTLYTLIEETKLGVPLGKTPEEARPAAAEMARSGRSGRIVAINLAALEALSKLVLDPDREDTPAALATVATARSIAESMPGDVAPLAAAPKTRPRVILLRSAVLSAREVAATAIPASLGIIVGFNSLDGD